MWTKLALVCFLASISFGQMMSMRSDGESMTITYGGNSFRGGAVTGAPYSGEQVSDHVQTLADGTHITQQRSSQKMWRDSQGRTRTERPAMQAMQPGQGSQFILVEINDPVAGAFYVIDDQNKIAHRLPLATTPARQRTPVTMTPEQRAAAEKARPQFATEKLGSQNIEGVIADGTRMTNTIPIGAQGNDRPMVTINENWTSQELKVPVLFKFSDPRNGESTTRLTNISRAEPDASLFMPPSGYEVVDEKDSFTMTVKR